MPCAWLGRSVRAELFALGVVNEGRPRVGGEDQLRAGWVFGVADCDGFGQVGDLDACAIGAAVAALAPLGRHVSNLDTLAVGAAVAAPPPSCMGEVQLVDAAPPLALTSPLRETTAVIGRHPDWPTLHGDAQR